jgi:hypothetical protein
MARLIRLVMMFPRSCYIHPSSIARLAEPDVAAGDRIGTAGEAARLQQQMWVK